MKRIVLLSFALVSLAGGKALAQQDPQFGHYMFNRLTYNPAYAGAGSALCATGVFRSQYMGRKSHDIDGVGGPRTYSLDVHTPVPGTANKYGLGVSAVQDAEGYFTTTNLNLAGSYNFDKLPIGGELRVGLNVGLLTKGLDAVWVMKDPNDPRLPAQSTASTFDLGVGAFYSRTNWYAGISAQKLPAGSLAWSQGGSVADYKVARVIYLNGGYTYEINGNKKYKLQPSVLVKYQSPQVMLGVTAMFLYNDQFYGALAFRKEHLNIPSVMAGMYFGKEKLNYKLGVNLDIPTKNVPSFGPNLEFMLGACYKLTLPTRTIIAPADPLKMGRERGDDI